MKVVRKSCLSLYKECKLENTFKLKQELFKKLTNNILQEKYLHVVWKPEVSSSSIAIITSRRDFNFSGIHNGNLA